METKTLSNVRPAPVPKASELEIPELRDCGRASERTKGVPNQFRYEASFPPFNTTYP
jgi:hypothetical protein